MQAVMNQVTENAKELGEIQYKVDQKHSSVLDEREVAIKARDEQLRCKFILRQYEIRVLF